MQREARARSRSPIARAKIHRHSGALPQPHQGDSSPPEPRKARMDTSALVPTRTSVQSFFTSTLDAIHTCPQWRRGRGKNAASNPCSKSFVRKFRRMPQPPPPPRRVFLPRSCRVVEARHVAACRAFCVLSRCRSPLMREATQGNVAAVDAATRSRLACRMEV